MSLPNVCEFKDRCEHQVTRSSFLELCMGHKVCVDGVTPWRVEICAWYEGYRNPPGSKALPTEWFKKEASQ